MAGIGTARATAVTTGALRDLLKQFEHDFGSWSDYQPGPDQHGPEGDRPFAPDQLPKKKCLEKPKPFLGGDIPAQSQDNMFGTDAGGAIG